MSSLLQKVSLKILIFMLVGIVAVTSTVLVQWQNYRTALANELQRVEQKHLLVAQNLSFALDRYLTDLSSLSEHLWEMDGSMPAGGLINDFNIIALGHESSGKFQLMSSDTQLTKDLESSESFRAFLDNAGENISISGLVNIGERQTFALAQRKGNVIHFTLLPLNYIRSIQDSIKFGDRGHSAIVDQYGNVLAHPNKTLEAKGASLLKVSIVQKMVEGGSGVSFFYSPPMQADMIAGHTTMIRSGWGIMVPQPLQEIEQGVWDDISSGTLVALIGLITMLSFGYLIATRLTQSLVRNIADLRLISEGKTVELTNQKNVSKESAELSNTLHLTARQVLDSRQKMADSLEIAQANIKQQNEFIDRVNHNLRTPLNAIAGVSELIDPQASDEELDEYSTIIRQSVSDIVGLLEERFELANLSKQEEN